MELTVNPHMLGNFQPTGAQMPINRIIVLRQALESKISWCGSSTGTEEEDCNRAIPQKSFSQRLVRQMQRAQSFRKFDIREIVSAQPVFGPDFGLHFGVTVMHKS